MIDRRALDELILKNDANDWWQPDRFRAHTKSLLPSELDLLLDPPAEEENYNCFLYALGLHSDPEVIAETSGFIYDSFFKHLLQKNELQITANPNDGDWVVYQDLVNYPDNYTHIGVLRDGAVVSKWAWGPLIAHALWDVPAEYGDHVFYVAGVDLQTAKSLYLQYRECNVKPHSTD